jgi:uroporphyrinogen decarboxylase
LDPIRTALALAAKQIAVLGGINGPLTIAFTLTGWDTLIYSLFDDQQLVRDIFRVATDFDLEAIRRMAQAGVDAICLAEDLAFNTGTFFSPVQYREFLFPFLAEIVAEAHRYNLPVLMHCDGQINAVLDDLVQMGIDGLNPVERKAGMDIAALKHKYAQRLCLVGNVDATRTLTHGTPNDVRREVLQLL